MPFNAAMGLAAASGAAGLGHEMLWTRRLVDVLGGTSEATSRVFGVFFVGLALGAALAVWLVPRVRRPWRAAAFAECLVALAIVPTVFLTPLTHWIWPALGPESLVAWPGGLAKAIVSAAVVLPPAVAMGLVLPLLAAASASGMSLSKHDTTRLYAANTFGGVMGLWLVVAVFLEQFGVVGSVLAVAAINLAVAAGCLVLERARGYPAADERPVFQAIDSKNSIDPQPRAWTWENLGLLGVAFLSGAGVLAAEVAGLQELLLWATLSFHAPAAILGAAILALAAAAAAVPRLLRSYTDPRQILPIVLAVTGIAMAITPLWFVKVAAWAGDPQSGSAAAFVIWVTFMTLVALGPALLTAGFVFPLAIVATDAGERRHGSDSAQRLAMLLAANGVGGLVGAELANRLLLGQCGLHGAFGAIGLAYAAAALVLAATASRLQASAWHKKLAWPAVAAAVTSWVAFAWLPQVPLVNPHIGFEVLSARAGPDGTVAVVRQAGLGRGILVANQYLLGSSGARWTEERQAHLPLVLHPRPREVLFVGVATGITPGAALAHKAVERVTAVEISPLVADAAATFFATENQGLFTDTRARVVVEDGRTLVAAATGQFDVIVGDLYLPWGSGAGRLYSVEHFEGVKRALAPGGLYCQWLPMYQLSEAQFDVIVATFRRVFPGVHFFRSSLDPARPGLALVGFADGNLDWATVAARTAQLREQGIVRDPAVRHAAGVGLLWLGGIAASEPAGTSSINTLDNVSLELDAASLRVTRGCAESYVHGRRWLDMVGGWLGESGRFGDRLEETRLARLGHQIAIWEAIRTQLPVNQAAAALETLRRQLPKEILEDGAADRNRWPGSADLLPVR